MPHAIHWVMTSQQFQVHCRVTKQKIINQSVQYSLQINSILAKQGNPSDSCKSDSLFPNSGTAMHKYYVLLINLCVQSFIVTIATTVNGTKR